MEYPSGIIFCNSNISSSVLNTLKQQLYVHTTIDISEYNNNLNYYNNLKITNKQRILVLISDFNITENRGEADVVIYISFGLAYILKNNFGPPGLCLNVDRLYIHKLLSKAKEYKL